MNADCRRPRSQGFSLKKMGGAESPGNEVGQQCGPHVRWLVEGQNASQNPKHVPETKNTSRNPKHVHPRIQNTSQNRKSSLDSGTCFVPMSYVTHASGAPLPEANHHFLNNNNIEKNKSIIVVTSKLYLHNYRGRKNNTTCKIYCISIAGRSYFFSATASFPYNFLVVALIYRIFIGLYDIF